MNLHRSDEAVTEQPDHKRGARAEPDPAAARRREHRDFLAKIRAHLKASEQHRREFDVQYQRTLQRIKRRLLEAPGYYMKIGSLRGRKLKVWRKVCQKPGLTKGELAAELGTGPGNLSEPLAELKRLGLIENRHPRYYPKH
jgi:hypothetical protein